jgi:hypothetical protein
MAGIDLATIFRMVTPYDFVGAAAVGSANAADEGNVVRQVLKILYGAGKGGSAYSCAKMIELLKELATGATDAQKKELARVIAIIADSTFVLPDHSNECVYKAADPMGDNASSEKTVTSIADMLTYGKDPLLTKEDVTGRYGVITVNSPFLGPQVRDAEKAEIFINSIPTIVMSRCSPYVELAFNFKRPGGTQLMTMGLLKFLMGGDQTPHDGATGAMISAETLVTGSAEEPMTYYRAGMEVFTSPQLLVNPSPEINANRYAPVLDPFRPLASLQSLTINVVSAGAGLYSYKKATAIIKLHDRSRLSELSDLVRPQVYTQTTVTLIYGWRHPPEPGNPYGEFINENMVKREAYGVQNASFALDQDGGVTINLELYMKGAHELNAIMFETVWGGAKDLLDRIQQMGERIQQLRQDMNLDPPTGVNAEIRAMTLLDAAGRGSVPEMTSAELVSAISKLEKSFKENNVDTNAANELIGLLNDMYKPKAPATVKPLQEELKGVYSQVANKKFSTMQSVPDPFMPYEAKTTAKMNAFGMGTITPPIIDALRGYLSPKNKGQQQQKQVGSANKQPIVHGRISGLVSFGTIFTAGIVPSVLTQSRDIGEVQVFFYQINDRAGKARCLNIAEFPVEISTLIDAYAEELERLGSNSMPIIGFMTMLIGASIDDMRSPAYGFRDFFNEKVENGKKTWVVKDEEGYANSQSTINGTLGSFQKPIVEVYTETVYEDAGGSPDVVEDSGKKIMRIHVFDRTVNPYRAASQIVKARVNGVDTYYALNDEYVRRVYATSAAEQVAKSSAGEKPNYTFLESSAGGYVKQNQINRADDSGNPTPTTYEQIKQEVSRLIPTITYGTNASNVTQASLSSKQDPLLTAAQLTGLNKNKRNSMKANGASIGGLPLQIIPAAMNMTMLGCPLLSFGQFWFVDFNTGTTADNIYTLTGLVHSFGPGKFDSQVTFSFYDAYGRYEGAPSVIKYLQATLKQLEPVKNKQQGKK